MDARPRGKIARLPREIRQALNERLLDGEPQSAVLAWLNALPEVRSRLAADFAGRPITKQILSEWFAGGSGNELTPLEKRAEYRRCFGLDPLPADHPDNDDINDPLGPGNIPMSFWQDVLDAEPVPDPVLGLDLIPPLVPPDHQFASEQEKKEAEFIRCRRVDTIRWAKWMALARRREAGLETPKLPPPTLKRKVPKPTDQARNCNCDSSPTKVDPCLPREASSEARATTSSTSSIPSSDLPGNLPSATESPAKGEARATPFPTPSRHRPPALRVQL